MFFFLIKWWLQKQKKESCWVGEQTETVMRWGFANGRLPHLINSVIVNLSWAGTSTNLEATLWLEFVNFVPRQSGGTTRHSSNFCAFVAPTQPESAKNAKNQLINEGERACAKFRTNKLGFLDVTGAQMVLRECFPEISTYTYRFGWRIWLVSIRLTSTIVPYWNRHAGLGGEIWKCFDQKVRVNEQLGKWASDHLRLVIS